MRLTCCILAFSPADKHAQAEERFGTAGFKYIGNGEYVAADGHPHGYAPAQQQQHLAAAPPSYGATQ